MIISLIAAVSKNKVIGRKNEIPWHLSADLKHFKELTMGHPIMMGRKTYESLGKALPGRTNIVLSRNPEFDPPDAVTVPSLQEALDLTRGEGEAFVIGGQSLYEHALPVADRMYITRVDTEVQNGDAFFPDFDEREWTFTSSEVHPKDEKNEFAYTYEVYERKSKKI